MKDIWKFAIGLMSGLLGAGLLFFLTRPPRGLPVTLLPAPSPAPVLVHVDGAIANPGVYSLAPESRVKDAIDAAGGLLADAHPQGINLAAFIQDGQRIWIPDAGESPASQNEDGLQIPSNGFSDTTSRKVNINTASQQELELLPEIGPVMASNIVRYREQYGLFTRIEDIQKVDGIGPATFEAIRELIIIEP